MTFATDFGRFRLWLIAGLAVTGATFSVARAAEAPEEQALRGAMTALTTEFMKPDADMTKLSSMIAESYVQTSGETGEIWDKKAWLKFASARRDDMKSGRWRIDHYDVSNQRIYWHGDSAAVVTFVLKSSGVRLDRPYAYQHSVTQVWTKEAGRWVRAAYHDSAPPPASSRVDVYAPEREVLAFETARREAVVRKDLKALDEMSAADLYYVDAHGIERNKADYLAHIKVENVAYSSYSLDEASAKVYGDLAVATGIFNFAVTVGERVNKGSQYYTAVYVREGGKWRLLIWHPTTVAPS